ncbi:MAG: ATP synthase F1 subunit epsilon [Planctomycetes bacterium]|nr:ATP synthase F1 subunit epsilon [Planctomycetota bacterium]
MADAISLRVITPDSILIDAPADSVRFPGLDGSIGVLPRHAHMVAALDAGPLSWDGPDGKGEMFVAGGFAEVRANTLRVVTQSGELVSDIDVERAEASAERARERLRVGGTASKAGELDSLRAQAALRRALQRMRMAQRR